MLAATISKARSTGVCFASQARAFSISRHAASSSSSTSTEKVQEEAKKPVPAGFGSLFSNSSTISGSSLLGNFNNMNLTPPASALSLWQTGKRRFSTGKPDSGEEYKETPEQRSLLQQMQGGLVFGAGVGFLGMSYYVTKGILGTIGAIYAKPHTIMLVGFWTGVSTTTCAAAAAFGLYRMTFIRPDNVFGQTSAIVGKNEQVQQLLGTTIKASNVRSYEIRDGRLALAAGSTTPYWKPHSCQMSYLIHGDKGTGLVTCKTTKIMSLVPGRLTIDLLALDIINSEGQAVGETIMLKGDKADLDESDSIYQMLSLTLKDRAKK